MEPWELWRDMARESQRAALHSETALCWRSSISRYYYAAYQAITAVLHYASLTSPVAEEAWSHAITPDLLEEHFRPYIPSRESRRQLRRLLAELYKLRIIADYRGRERPEIQHWRGKTVL